VGLTLESSIIDLSISKSQCRQRTLSSHSPIKIFPVLVFNGKAKYHHHRQITINSVFSHPEEGTISQSPERNMFVRSRDMLAKELKPQERNEAKWIPYLRCPLPRFPASSSSLHTTIARTRRWAQWVSAPLPCSFIHSISTLGGREYRNRHLATRWQSHRSCRSPH